MPDVRKGVAASRNEYVETRRDNAIAQSLIAFRHHRTIVTVNYILHITNNHMRCKEALDKDSYIKVATSFHINYPLYLAKDRNYDFTMATKLT